MQIRQAHSEQWLEPFLAYIEAEVVHLSDIPFGITDWRQIDPTEHASEVGVARWRTRQFGPVRVRLVEYPPG